jgi:oxygen-independent coproporphyrinogen-3 oxidase
MKEVKEKKSLGLYFHFPYCVSKCRYCNFCSFPVGEDIKNFDAYISRLKAEIIDAGSTFGDEYFIDSIYFGGGTPSLMEPKTIWEIMETLRSFFQIMETSEITIEVNPGTVDLEKMREYRACGINRISIGVQSFNDDVLKYLGRIHTADEAINAIQMAKLAGFSNISADIIFSVPNTTIEDVMADLEQIIALDITHLSLYSLELEKDAPLFKDIEMGLVRPIEDIADRATYHMANEFLEQNNMHQYEISNYARPGKQAVHNKKYWTLDEYLGIGLSAHSYMRGFRFSNTEKMVDYLASRKKPEIVRTLPKMNKLEEMGEFIWLGLRLNQGVDKQIFKDKFGEEIDNIFGIEIDRLAKRDLLKNDGASIALTPLGRDLSNQVFIEFIETGD